jgi:hypothetical protein
MRQTLLNSVFVNFSLPFQPSVTFIQCSEVFVYYNLLQELIFVSRQMEIEGLWLKILPGVDAQRTASSNGLARSPLLSKIPNQFQFCSCDRLCRISEVPVIVKKD